MKIPSVPQRREEKRTLFLKMKRAFVGTIIFLKVCPMMWSSVLVVGRFLAKEGTSLLDQISILLNSFFTVTRSQEKTVSLWRNLHRLKRSFPHPNKLVIGYFWR